MHFACNLSDLTERKPYIVTINDTDIGVIFVDNEIHAYENFCPHEGGPVCLGDIFGRIKVQLGENKEVIKEYVDDSEPSLVCPWHGYEYDVKTGVCVADNKISLRKFPTQVEDGKVYILDL